MATDDYPFQIETFGSLKKHGYTLTGYCQRCGESGRQLDLNSMPEHVSYIGRIFTCKDCGGRMDITVNPPSGPRER